MLRRPRLCTFHFSTGGLALAGVLILGPQGPPFAENAESSSVGDRVETVRATRSPAVTSVAEWALAAGAGSVGRYSTQQQLAPLPDLREYDWTSWIVGAWEGWIEDSEGNRTAMEQSFEYVADGRHILTRLRIGDEQSPQYFGVGIFSYDPVRGLATGEWFGMLGDRNYALARRDGERWAWDIFRHGRRRVLRVRERVSEDEYRVTSTSSDAEGRERVTREHMQRVK